MDLGYPRLKCTQVEGNEWNWTGMNKFERDRTGLERKGTDSTQWTGVHISGVTGLNWTEPDSSSED